jgi:signal transduction histidine kinase
MNPHVSTPLSILLIEDDDADALLLTRKITRSTIHAIIHRVSTLDELRAALRHDRFDLVISDYLLPGFDGFIATQLVRELDPELPVIIISGMAGEELAVQAMQAGAHDYLLKNKLERLDVAIRAALTRAEHARTARRATEALAASEARLRLALEAASMIVWEWDIHSDTLRWSGASLLDADATHGSLPSLDAAMASLHPDDAPYFQRTIDACLIGSQPDFSAELRIMDAQRKERWVLVTGRIFQSDDPPAWKIAGTATDITNRKALERQLVRSQNLEGLGRLASGIAHDFNNLLTILMGYLTIAQIEADDHPALLDVLGPMREATESAATLTRQLLGFARRQRISPRRVNADELLHDSARLFHRLLGDSIQLVIDVEPRCWPLKADPGQLQQLLLTLIVNARDAMPDGGAITLRARNLLVQSYTPALQLQPGAYITLCVIDQGTGMSPDLLAHLFEPFYNVEGHEQGTSLGLATAHGIVAQHGGAMTAESTQGQGSCISLTLPRHAPPAALDAGAAQATLLIVDEHAIIHKMSAAILRDADHRVLHARDASQAIELAATTPITLLLTDHSLPDMTGHALADLLRTRHPALRVLPMSALPGCPPDTLAKPFTADSLLTAITHALA